MQAQRDGLVSHLCGELFAAQLSCKDRGGLILGEAASRCLGGCPVPRQQRKKGLPIPLSDPHKQPYFLGLEISPFFTGRFARASCCRLLLKLQYGGSCCGLPGPVGQEGRRSVAFMLQHQGGRWHEELAKHFLEKFSARECGQRSCHIV